MTKTSADTEDLRCGLVMPISAISGCGEQHWMEVKEILTDAVERAGFSANLVSFADDVGVIQKRIVQNLYDNPIVVCDISARNPNVMFELGMRLAFDKPTVVIKDDKTDYAFDTSPIEHLEYPRDLRFSKVVEFKEALCGKVKATYEKAKEDESYTSFLKNFGTFKVAKLETKEVSKEEIIMDELREIRKSMRYMMSFRGDTMSSDFFDFGMRYPESGISQKIKECILKVVEENYIDVEPKNLSSPAYKMRIFEDVLKMDKTFRALRSDKNFISLFNSIFKEISPQFGIRF